MMAVSSEGSATSNSSNNNSSKVSNLSGTFMGDYQNGSEGANSSERESISPYRSTNEEVKICLHKIYREKNINCLFLSWLKEL